MDKTIIQLLTKLRTHFTFFHKVKLWYKLFKWSKIFFFFFVNSTIKPACCEKKITSPKTTASQMVTSDVLGGGTFRLGVYFFSPVHLAVCSLPSGEGLLPGSGNWNLCFISAYIHSPTNRSTLGENRLPWMRFDSLLPLCYIQSVSRRLNFSSAW